MSGLVSGMAACQVSDAIVMNKMVPGRRTPRACSIPAADTPRLSGGAVSTTRSVMVTLSIRPISSHREDV